MALRSHVEQLCRAQLLSGALLSVFAGPVLAAYIDAAGCCRHGAALALQTLEATTCDPGTAPTDFEGEICQIIDDQGVGLDGHAFANLSVSKFDMVGTHPTFGSLQISLDPTRPGSSGTLRAMNAGSDFPVIHTTRINITAVASNLPGIVLQNQGPPVEFVGDPSNSWPPTQNVYTMAVDVPFENRDNPGAVLIDACAGSVTVFGSITPPPLNPAGRVGPSISEWGMILVVLLGFVAGTHALRRQPMGLATGGLESAETSPPIDWDRLGKAVLGALAVQFAACVAAYFIWGGLAARDVIGGLMVALVGGYLLYLWASAFNTRE